MFESTVKCENDHIFVKPLCDFFKIDYQNQVERIKRDPILMNSYGKNRNKMLFGDNYPRVSLTKIGFIRRIQIMNPLIIPDHMRQQFMTYQMLIFDFFYGTAEREIEIRKLTGRKDQIEEQMKRLTNERRFVVRSLSKALNEKYHQYMFNF